MEGSGCGLIYVTVILRATYKLLPFFKGLDLPYVKTN
jgi:hypothetical protein